MFLCRFELRVQVRYVIKANSFKYFLFVVFNTVLNVFISSARKGKAQQSENHN